MPNTRPHRATRTAMLTLAVATLATTTLTTGCSDGSTPRSGITSASLPGTDTPTSTTPSPTGPVPPTPLTYTPGDPQSIGAWIEVTAPANLTPDQKAALQAWTTYWQITMQAYNTLGENISTTERMKYFDAVATGQAKQQTIDGVRTRANHRGLTVGAVKFKVSSIQLGSTTATIKGCVDDRSYEVDQEGKTVVRPPGNQPFGDTVTRSGSQWKVSATPTLPGTC